MKIQLNLNYMKDAINDLGNTKNKIDKTYHVFH